MSFPKPHLEFRRLDLTFFDSSIGSAVSCVLSTSDENQIFDLINMSIIRLSLDSKAERSEGEKYRLFN